MNGQNHIRRPSWLERVIKSVHLSRPENYLSIYQSGCNFTCRKCHSSEFSQKASGEWFTDAKDTGKVFSGEPTLRTWKRDLKRAGLITETEEGYCDERRRRLDRKCLRTSFCTWLKEAGVDLRDAQKLMRHSDPKLTSNIYTDVRLSDLRGAVEKIESLADQGEKKGRGKRRLA